MKYRRKVTRPPRAVEESAAMRETARLQEEIRRVRKDLASALERAVILESLNDELQRDIGRLAVELRHERNKVSFLQGFDGIGHEPWDIRKLF